MESPARRPSTLAPSRAITRFQPGSPTRPGAPRTLPQRTAALRYRPWPDRPGLRRATYAAALVGLALVVIVFSDGWRNGGLTFDGTGESLYVRLALDQWRSLGRLTPWVPNMWGGTPVWSLVPSLPVVAMLPLASLFGVDTAVKLGCLGAQILGATGAYVLARSLWGRSSGAFLAGLFYGLAPIFVSQSLFGVDRASWVIGLTPWVFWAFRRAIRGEGRRRGLMAMALAGVLTGVAVLEQAEQAYSLVFPCLFVLAIELSRVARPGAGTNGWRANGSRANGSPLTRGAILLRAGGVGAVAVGLCAHWLFPFLSMQKSFILSPPAVVNDTLLHGVGAVLARNPGGFLTRAAGMPAGATYPVDFVSIGSFYLGWLLLAATAVGIALLPKHDGGGELTAIVLAAAVGVWLSTGAIPLASSGLAVHRQVLPFVIVGALSGLLLGAFVRHLQLGRFALVFGLVAAVLLVSLPYLTPFLALRTVVPFLASVRFPRFFSLAILGLALGAAFPVVVLERRFRDHEPRLTTLLSVTASLVLIGLFLVDLHTYRSYYQVKPPTPGDAYERLLPSLDPAQTGERLATTQYGTASAVNAMVGSGLEMSVGWPHPIASKDVWSLTAELLTAPYGYRNRALALSATAGIVDERVVGPPDGRLAVDDVTIQPNPDVLPRVRAYDQAVVVDDEDLATELAIQLSQGGVGVVTGGSGAAKGLGKDGRTLVEGVHCDSGPIPARLGPLTGDVAMGCALHNDVRGRDASGAASVAIDNGGAGAIFRSPLPDLHGVSVWLNQGPSVIELALYELAPDGRSLGPEVRRTLASGFDDNGMVAFTFDPIPDSANKRYVFLLTCDRCQPGEHPAMIAAKDRPRPADVVHGGKVLSKLTGAFVPLFNPSPAVAPSSTTVKATELGAGSWRVSTSGSRPSLVVVADAYFPGWSATVDGKKAKVEEADGAFLGVVVGAGNHTIRLSYHNGPAALVGRVVTGLTVVALLVLLLPADLTRRRLTAAQAGLRSLRS